MEAQLLAQVLPQATVEILTLPSKQMVMQMLVPMRTYLLELKLQTLKEDHSKEVHLLQLVVLSGRMDSDR